MEKLQDNNPEDPTSLWYFLTIHDSILHPLVGFLKWKDRKRREEAAAVSQKGGDDTVKRAAATLATSPAPEEIKRPKLLPTVSEQAPS